MGFFTRSDAHEFTYLNIDDVNLDDYTFENIPQYLHTHSKYISKYSDEPKEKIIYKINDIEFINYK